jgi:transposase
LHAGGSEGFVKNGLLIFKSGLKSGDYHDHMNHKNYTKWLQEKLIPNLELNSVVVIDNALYHNLTVEPNPNSDWKRNIFCDWSKSKPELYEKIKIHKSNRQFYATDKL